MAMFNQSGLEHVSTRHIAEKMGISVGNLHYHFPTKGDLVAHLFGLFIHESNLLARQLDTANPGKSVSLRNTVVQTFQLIYRHRYLFNSLQTVFKILPSAKPSFEEMLSARSKQFFRIKNKMVENKILRGDISDDQYDKLFLQISYFYNSWTTQICLLSGNNSEEVIINHFSEVAVSLWYPYFTDSYLKH